MTTVYDFSLTTIDGESCPLSTYKGHALLVVNVASRCGLTPQYQGLEALYREYRGRGLEVLGIPCNDFGAQEPGTEAEIKDFCQSNYQVSFPLFSKLHVLGEEQAPLYTFLTKQALDPDGKGEVAWNFAKFLVNKQGEPTNRFAPATTANDPQLISALEKLL